MTIVYPIDIKAGVSEEALKGTVPLKCGTCGKLLHVALLGRGEELHHDGPDGTPCKGVQPARFNNEIVALEPMKMPAGAVFDLEYKYGKKP